MGNEYTYTSKELDRLHTQNFRTVAANYPKGDCVGLESWRIRMTATGAALVTTYQVRDAKTGEWSENQERIYTL